MIRIIRAMLLLLMPGLAFAEISGPFTPVADDISMKVINQIFGGLLTGGNDAFGSAISTFNGAVLIVGGILATYTLLAGTLGTAHDGEMLGKKFSSVWIPIRYALGTSLVLPVLSGGYCVMQQLVMWLVVQGVGLADMAWDAYMKTPGIAANMSISKNTEDKARALAENIFMAQICVAANKHAVEHSDSILTLASRYDFSMSYDADKRTYSFGDQKGVTSSWNKNNCGEVSFGEKIQNSTVAAGPGTSNVGYLGPLDNLFAPTDIQPINQAHETATKTLVDAAAATATAVVESEEMDAKSAAKLYAGIDAATKAYLESVKAAANAVAMSPSDTTRTAHQYGWFMAGAYFMNTVVTNNKITNAIAAVPDSKFAKDSFNDQAEAMQELGLKVLAAGNPLYGSAAKAINAKKQNESSKQVAELDFSGRVMNAITRGLTAIDFYSLKNDSRHPVIVINEMGARLQAYWTGMVVLLIGVTVAGGVASILASGIASTITNVLIIIVGFLGLPIMALAATSFTASYLIPMLPFMMWLGILGGWLIAVVISILAAPLWAVMHLHPNGDDLTGRGGNGYMLVLGLLLRPVLAVFGFIAAVTISSVMGEFINKVFFQVFSFSQGDGKGLGFFIGVIAGTAIYVAIMFSFIKKSFSLMHVIPDELMKWIGGGGDQLGHYAGKMGDGATGAVGAVAAFTAGRGLGQNLNNTGRQLGDAGKQYRADKKKLANEEKNKQFQGLKNQKEFDQFKQQMDDKFGDGAGERLATSMGLTAANIDGFESQAKLYAMSTAMAAVAPYGDEAKQALVGAMEQAAQEGFASHGGPKEALADLSQGIAKNAIIQQAEAQIGSSAGEYLRTVAGDGNGGIDTAKAQKAMSDLGKAKDVLGSDFQAVFNQAMSNHGDNAAAVTADIAGAYQAAKNGGAVVGQTVNEKVDFPQVVDTPVFNPETGQVDGLVEPPQQPVSDSNIAAGAQPSEAQKIFNQATLDQFGSGADTPPPSSGEVKDNGI